MPDESQPQLPPPTPVKVTPPGEVKSIRKQRGDVFWTVLILVMWLVVIIAAILLVLGAVYVGWGILKWLYKLIFKREVIKAALDYWLMWV